MHRKLSALATAIAVVALGLVLFRPNSTETEPQAKKESAYERVMRTGVIRCGYVLWPPYFEKDVTTGELRGLSKDLSDLVFNALSLKADYVEANMAFRDAEMESGKYDAMCGDGPWSLAIMRKLSFSSPFGYAPVFVYARSDETRLGLMEDANKTEIRFVGVDGDISAELARTMFPQATQQTLQATADPAEMLMNVTTGKADAAITDPLTAEKFLAGNVGSLQILFNQKALALYPFGFSVAKGEEELLATLNNAVDMMHNIKAIEPVFMKWDPSGKNFVQRASDYRSTP